MRKIKAGIVLSIGGLALFFAVLGGRSEAGYLDRALYCKLNGASIRVYLSAEEGTLKCKAYKDALNTYLQKEYQTLLQLITNLNRGDDRAYWKQLYEQKKSDFLKLFSQRQLIQNAMNEFGDQLLKKSQAYLRDFIETKQQELTFELEDIQSQIIANESTVQANTYHLLKRQKEVLGELQTTDSIEIFMEKLSLYLSIIQQIAWK